MSGMNETSVTAVSEGSIISQATLPIGGSSVDSTLRDLLTYGGVNYPPYGLQFSQIKHKLEASHDISSETDFNVTDGNLYYAETFLVGEDKYK